VNDPQQRLVVTLTVEQFQALVREQVQAVLRPTPVIDKPYLTVAEASEHTSLAPSTLRLAIRKGHLKANRVGRRVVISRANLDRFIGT